ncbi:MAG TPA: ABC transporter C-terminal domain-containing protein, partial [Microthrixaceae bacterium]|nr:ABC transporter C-terminal domain-containing protein [Microthrixaceae bacterium]
CGYAAYENQRRLLSGGRKVSATGRGATDRPLSGAGAGSTSQKSRTGGAGANSGSSAEGSAASESAKSTRSSSTIRFQLKAVDKELKAAQRRHAKLQGEMAEVASDGDHARLAELSVELAAIDTVLADAEERWLELAAEAEEVGMKL